MMRPTPPTPEIPGEKWHKETYEESLKAKPKQRHTTIVREDDTQDDSGWVPQNDDTGLEN